MKKRIELPFVFRMKRPEKGEVVGANPTRLTGVIQSELDASGSSVVRVPPPPLGKFDRNAYQRDYMRDRRKAKALGLTVSQYRERMKG